MPPTYAAALSVLLLATLGVVSGCQRAPVPNASTAPMLARTMPVFA